MFENERDQQLEEQQLNWREYFSIVYRGRWWIFFIFLLVFSASTFYTLRMPEVYKAHTILEIEPDANMYSGSFGMMGGGNDRNIMNHMQLIKSRTVSKYVIDKIDRYPGSEYITLSKLKSKGVSVDSRIDIIRSKINVEPIKNTDIVKISIDANSPFEAAYLANTVAEQYVNYSLGTNQGEIGAITEFLKEQLDIIKIKLKTSEVELQSYKEKEGVVLLSEETKLMIQELSKFTAQYNTALTEVSAIDKRIEFLKNKLDDKQKKLVEFISRNTAPEIKAYKESISKLHSKISDLEISNQPGAKNYIEKYKKQIEKYKEEIKAQANIMASSEDAGVDPLQVNSDLVLKIMSSNAERISLEAKVVGLKVIVDKYDEQMTSLPGQSLELARLERINRIYEETYIMMYNKYEEYRISQAGLIGNARIVDRAIAPTKAYKPNKPLYITFSAVIGLALGIFIAFVIAFFDTTIKTIEDIEKFGFPFLGAVPTINLAQLQKKMNIVAKDLNESELKKIETRLVTHFSPKSPISESYRSIRTNIQFSKIDDPPKVILVSSSIPKEGKSTTVCNLAVTISQSGNRTLIVDGDLRRPVIHKKFNLLREIGITDYLVKGKSIEEIAKKTDVENLYVITCGEIPHNPSELLGSKKMEAFIKDVRDKFDFVIIDSPPVITVTDATVLSRKVDGVIIVVSSGNVGKTEINRSAGLIQSIGSNLIGVILNSLDIKKLYGNYYYYYHYYHYYYYYGTDKKEKKRRVKRKKSQNKNKLI